MGPSFVWVEEQKVKNTAKKTEKLEEDDAKTSLAELYTTVWYAQQQHTTAHHQTFCFGPKARTLYVTPMSRAPAAPAPSMKGYFAVGVERISKAHNVGAIMRTAHAFGASYFFSVNSPLNARHLKQTDTSKATSALPFYEYTNIDELKLPKGAKLVGVELTPDAVDLPTFKHPRQAVYILGPEGGNLSPDIIAQCDHTVKIPMRFCVNVGIAAALVMYDRLLNLGPQLPRS